MSYKLYCCRHELQARTSGANSRQRGGFKTQ